MGLGMEKSVRDEVPARSAKGIYLPSRHHSPVGKPEACDVLPIMGMDLGKEDLDTLFSALGLVT